ncbi:SGNH/GDSL hydrolase family protein [Tessaracoccus oleiagri]|uniref:SGNH/GDSL hydrolase family protein n=1 Tax=Tessaracoccus oleiagri TaxID=686624 RepID=A0A1G9N7B2_9ACTN|nr:SGNH/GDSL hydrolase family protein [Tessaracoccus oleiagri]SDL82442.1 hypothetical protein SAMN04488242_2950 [Tessaracoccus oleiagri]
MLRRPLISLAVGLVALALLGTAAYAFYWDPQPTYKAAPNDAASRVSPQELERAAEQRVFFGHMSVGNNVISGLRQLYEAHDVAPPNFIETDIGEIPSLDEDGGAFVHTLIGENRHPYRKLENFEAMLRGGLADQVDVALIKFCYIDLRWDSDVEKLFETYKATMAQLEADYPHVRFVHLTAPLTTGPYGIKDHIKMVVGRNDNATRERYNALIRAEYGPDRVFDIAALESRAPDGAVKAELYSGYSNDGAHLNETGAALVAAEFVRMLNATPN